MNKELEVLVRTATAEDSRTARVQAYMEARKFGYEIFEEVLRQLNQSRLIAFADIESETSPDDVLKVVRDVNCHTNIVFVEEIVAQLDSTLRGSSRIVPPSLDAEDAEYWDLCGGITMIGITSAELIKRDNPNHPTDGLGLGVVVGVVAEEDVERLRRVIGYFQYGIPIKIKKVGRAIAH